MFLEEEKIFDFQMGCQKIEHHFRRQSVSILKLSKKSITLHRKIHIDN
jgi:hypothetical protein